MIKKKINIYVDTLLPWGFKMYGRHFKTCHLFTDGTETDLISFGENMGLKKSWLHRSPSMVHYDLIPSKRAIAIEKGARPVDRGFVNKFMMERQGQHGGKNTGH